MIAVSAGIAHRRLREGGDMPTILQEVYIKAKAVRTASAIQDSIYIVQIGVIRCVIHNIVHGQFQIIFRNARFRSGCLEQSTEYAAVIAPLVDRAEGRIVCFDDRDAEGQHSASLW